jgi:hypothetical protein
MVVTCGLWRSCLPGKATCTSTMPGAVCPRAQPGAWLLPNLHIRWWLHACREVVRWHDIPHALPHGKRWQWQEWCAQASSLGFSWFLYFLLLFLLCKKNKYVNAIQNKGWMKYYFFCQNSVWQPVWGTRLGTSVPKHGTAQQHPQATDPMLFWDVVWGAWLEML